jgi:hypothetical protein
VTFEYVLLGGLNDGLQHAERLAMLARSAPMPVKINLIAWNPGPGISYAMPAPEQVAAFQQRLIARGVPAFLRRPRGRDIYAACGQLKRTVTEIQPAVLLTGGSRLGSPTDPSMRGDFCSCAQSSCLDSLRWKGSARHFRPMYAGANMGHPSRQEGFVLCANASVMMNFTPHSF